MTRSVLWQQGGTYQAQDDRHLMAALWPTGGVINGMAVTVGTGRTVNIAAGNAAVSMGGNEGTALAISDAIETATFAAAPSSGQNRIDLLIAQVHDPSLDVGTTTGFTFDIVVGTAAASPVAPAVPARALVIATVTSVGGQANLAQANIVAGLKTNTGLPYDVNVSQANIALPSNTPVVIMSTGVLAVGVWFIIAIYTAYNSGQFIVSFFSPGTAQVGVVGPASAEVNMPSGVESIITSAAILNVVTPGTVTMSLQSSSAGFCLAAQGGFGYRNCTGYVAIKIV